MPALRALIVVRRSRNCAEESFAPSSPSISSTKVSTCLRSTPCSCFDRPRAPRYFSSSWEEGCGGQSESGSSPSWTSWARFGAKYRYDVRYRALLGGTRHQVRRAVEADFPLLPPGCALKLDRIAKETVLRNLKEAVHNARARLADDLRALGPDTRLGCFMRDAGVELDDIYARPGLGHCFAEIRRRAGFEQSTILAAADDSLLKAIGRLIHVDDHERLKAWRDILEADHSDGMSGLQGRKHRLGLMLFAVLGGRRQSIDEADQILERVRESAEWRREISDLLEILADRIRTVSRPLDPTGEVPLASHATYTLGEIVAAHRRTDKHGALVFPPSGVLWNEATQTDLLFVTLEKSNRDYSPSTRYADYPISPTLFHWESQNSASLDAPPGAGTWSKRPGARRSSSSCANAKGMAGARRFLTTVSAMPGTEVMNRKGP